MSIEQLAGRYWAFVERHSPERAVANRTLRTVTTWADLSPAARFDRRSALESLRADLAAVHRAGGDRAGAPADAALTASALAWELDNAVEQTRHPTERFAINPIYGPHHTLVQAAGDTLVEDGDEADAYIQRLAAFPSHVEGAIASAEEGLAADGTISPRVGLERVPGQIRALLDSEDGLRPLARPLEASPAAYEPWADRLARTVESDVRPALARLAGWVEANLDRAPATSALARDDAGHEWYAACVRDQTSLDVDVDRLEAIGTSAVARLLETADAIAGAGDIRSLLARAERAGPGDFDSPGDLFDAHVRTCSRIDGGLHRVVAGLPSMPYEVEAMPEVFAGGPIAYYIPSSVAANRPGKFWVNVVDWETRRAWTTMPLCLHESVPGHHLQIALADDRTDLPAFRRHGVWNGYVEGWAVYSERLADLLDLDLTTGERLGLIAHQSWRAARLVVDSGIHLRGWTVDEAAAFLTRAAGLPATEARSEAIRYSCWPGQATGYWLGAEAIGAAVQAAVDAEEDLRTVHSRLLGSGPLPLAVLSDLWPVA